MKTIKRAWLILQMRAIETQIDGMSECLEMVSDRMLTAKIQIARSVARRELCRIRGEYNALLPAGRRVTWRMA